MILLIADLDRRIQDLADEIAHKVKHLEEMKAHKEKLLKQKEEERRCQNEENGQNPLSPNQA